MKVSLLKPITRGLLAAVVMPVAPAALAAAVNTAFVSAPGEPGGSKLERGPGVVLQTADYGRAPAGENPGAATQNRASASPGSIGVRSSSEGSVASGTATASTTGTYRIVGAGDSVDASLNLHLEGGLAVDGGPRSPSAGASILLQYTLGRGGTRTFSASLAKGANLSPAALTLTGPADNPFGDASGGGALTWSGLYTTPTVTLPVGVDLSFQLLATARSSLGSGVGDPAAFGRAGAEFADTFSLPSGIDVFNLPAGYTVQSSDLMIVDNRYLAGVVPEPSTLALSLVGLGLVAGGTRRRRPGHAAGATM